jgi:ribosomal protein S18 acetylase RimI-like enzyme
MHLADDMEISATRVDEVDQIMAVAREVQIFTTEEVDTIKELLDEYIAKGDASQYYFLSCRSEGQVVGFACYGPRPLTRGTFDLYWIGTSSGAQRRGVGAALIAQVERNVRAIDGRLLVVETSSSQEYEPARHFYESHGYRRQAIVEDFYDEGDHLVLYSKRLKTSSNS